MLLVVAQFARHDRFPGFCQFLTKKPGRGPDRPAPGTVDVTGVCTHVAFKLTYYYLTYQAVVTVIIRASESVNECPKIRARPSR
jgi:hypothetical protein